MPAPSHHLSLAARMEWQVGSHVVYLTSTNYQLMITSNTLGRSIGEKQLGLVTSFMSELVYPCYRASDIQPSEVK